MALQADFETLEAKFDGLEEKFSGLEAKFDGLRFTLNIVLVLVGLLVWPWAGRSGLEAVRFLKPRRLCERSITRRAPEYKMVRPFSRNLPQRSNLTSAAALKNLPQSYGTEGLSGKRSPR